MIEFILWYLAVGFVPYTLAFFFLENGGDIDDQMFCVDITPAWIASYIFFWFFWIGTVLFALVALVFWFTAEYSFGKKKLFNTCDLVNRFRKKGKHE